jgi:hypothetical protein
VYFQRLSFTGGGSLQHTLQHIRHDLRDSFQVFREADELVAKSSVGKPLRNLLIRKYVAAARAGSTWCPKEIRYQVAKLFGVRTRTYYNTTGEADSTVSEYHKPTTISGSTAKR